MATTGSITEVISQGRAWFDNQVAQTERLRPMLAAGAGIIFVALLAFTISLAQDSLRGLRASQLELARLNQQVNEGSWPKRRQESETLRFQLRERFWTAETAGLAEASLERWLRERIERLGIRPDTIRVQRAAVASANTDSSRQTLAGVQRMTAKVIMPFEPEALLQLIGAAASNEKLLVVDRLLIRAGRNALIEMDISTFLVLPEGSK
ncbi:MAG: hypothetical protein EXR11_09640 [Rhodospirillaceae bacterium]|nr:hypothetical protein [Rhodospirillaceae bacterium]